MDLNHRPPGPEPGALARLRYSPTALCYSLQPKRDYQINIAPRPGLDESQLQEILEVRGHHRLLASLADGNHPSCRSLASVMAGMARTGSRMARETLPSTRTRDTASAPRCASRRPRANVAILTPSLPRVVPIWPMTPGSSRFLRYSMVPSSCASSGIPSICSTRGEPSWRTVPSAVKPATEPLFS